jgi:geranylgeranylglycerol-phosphate geranylgeranyltransferase
MVSSSVAITYVLGGIAVAEPWSKIVWSFSMMAFLIDLGEEIAGGAMDIEGDKRRNSKSFAILLGENVALLISGSLFVLVVLISMFPVFLGWRCEGCQMVDDRPNFERGRVAIIVSAHNIRKYLDLPIC